MFAKVVRRDGLAKANQIVGPLVVAISTVYLLYHAFQGDRGLIAWWNLRFEIEQANLDLASVSAEKKTLEHRVALLRPDSLDRDMLEERARQMLGSVGPDDLVVPVAPTPEP